MTTLATKVGGFLIAPLLFLGAQGQYLVHAPNAHASLAPLGNTSVQCTRLSQNLYYGLTDASSTDQVSQLQTFLNEEAYLQEQPTGTYDLNTLIAVQAFQRAENMVPSGYVGPGMFGVIKKASCGTEITIKSIDGPTALQPGETGSWNVDVSSMATGTLSYSVKWGDESKGPMRFAATMQNGVQASSTFTHTYETPGTYTPVFTVSDSDGDTVSKKAAAVVVSTAMPSAPQITSLNPTSGKVGSTVTITGTNFTSTSTVALDSTIASSTLNSNGTLSFTVPSLPIGTHAVVVSNGSQQSNAVNFTITATPPSISIEGLDAPVTLVENQLGTWTVHVATSAANLHYSAVWGDEGMAARFMMALLPTTQTSSTFTHSYASAGTFTPKFTVSDDSGHSANVSASVIVTGTTTTKMSRE